MLLPVSGIVSWIHALCMMEQQQRPLRRRLDKISKKENDKTFFSWESLFQSICPLPNYELLLTDSYSLKK